VSSGCGRSCDPAGMCARQRVGELLFRRACSLAMRAQ
jgi:hypothetical protein